MGRLGADREKICRCARRLFEDRGYAPVTMAEIAAAAGISRKTLYRHYSGKEAVALAIETSLFKAYHREMEELLPSLSGSGIERLEGYFRHMEEILDRHAGAIRFTGLFDHHVFGGNEDFTRAVTECSHHLSSLIRRGVEDGSLRPNIDVALTAETLGESWLSLAQRILNRGEALILPRGWNPGIFFGGRMNSFWRE